MNLIRTGAPEPRCMEDAADDLSGKTIAPHALSHVESSTKSTQNYEITGKEGYGCISRIGNTCFYSVADKDYKKEVKDFKKEFGY